MAPLHTISGNVVRDRQKNNVNGKSRKKSSSPKNSKLSPSSTESKTQKTTAPVNNVTLVPSQCFLTNAEEWKNWVCTPVEDASSSIFCNKAKAKNVCLLCGLKLPRNVQWTVHSKGFHHERTFHLFQLLQKMKGEANGEKFDKVVELIKEAQGRYSSAVTIKQKRAFYNLFASIVMESKQETVSLSAFNYAATHLKVFKQSKERSTQQPKIQPQKVDTTAPQNSKVDKPVSHTSPSPRKTKKEPKESSPSTVGQAGSLDASAGSSQNQLANKTTGEPPANVPLIVSVDLKNIGVSPLRETNTERGPPTSSGLSAREQLSSLRVLDSLSPSSSSEEDNYSSAADTDSSVDLASINATLLALQESPLGFRLPAEDLATIPEDWGNLMDVTERAASCIAALAFSEMY